MEQQTAYILICTDRALLHNALERMMQDSYACKLVTPDGARASANCDPAAVILDAETGMSGLIRGVRAGVPRVPIVAWQRSNSTEASLHALEWGVQGVLTDQSSREEILACLKTVAGGHVSVPQPVAQALLDFRRFHVTPREWQVIRLVSQGLRNKEIAYILGIAEGTVKVYLSRMFDKLDVSDRYELALLGLRQYSSPTPSKPTPEGSDSLKTVFVSKPAKAMTVSPALLTLTH